MIIDNDNNLHPAILDVVNSINELFREIGVEKFDRFDQVTFETRKNDKYECEIKRNNHIVISDYAINLIWATNFAHLNYYQQIIGMQSNAQEIKLGSHNWDLSVSALTWAVDEIAKRKYNEMPVFGDVEIETNSGKIFKYSLMFLIAHELFHSINNGKFDDARDEERQCDKDATLFLINSRSDSEYLLKVKGIALALTFFNVSGFHTENFGGDNHPFDYDRLIDNLSYVFGEENDKIWGFVVAMFMLHMREKKIAQPKQVFEKHYDCIIAYKGILEKQY